MEFQFSFTVNAPVTNVATFHRDSGVLKHLTPLPIIAQIHQFEPMAEGSSAHFTLWFGPIPVVWHAVHSDVTDDGFTDTQISGLLRSWRHKHRFVAVSPNVTCIKEHIVYQHDSGFRGLMSRLLFNRFGLLYLFTARKFLTRRRIARQANIDRAASVSEL